MKEKVFGKSEQVCFSPREFLFLFDLQLSGFVCTIQRGRNWGGEGGNEKKGWVVGAKVEVGTHEHTTPFPLRLCFHFFFFAVSEWGRDRLALIPSPVRGRTCVAGTPINSDKSRYHALDWIGHRTKSRTSCVHISQPIDTRSLTLSEGGIFCIRSGLRP